MFTTYANMYETKHQGIAVDNITPAAYIMHMCRGYNADPLTLEAKVFDIKS